jgi:hypothetical protein
VVEVVVKEEVLVTWHWFVEEVVVVVVEVVKEEVAIRWL